jgi:meckelin
LVIRQASADIFFIDWEKPKAGMKNFFSYLKFFIAIGNANTVSVWRTYFVANEFHEIQTFRRINPTFQLFFVLFLLKVIKILSFFRIWINLNREILFLR